MIESTHGEPLDSSPYVELGDKHLRFREDTPYEVWGAVLKRLKSAEKAIQWWLGDALRFGERKYGEMYSQALEEIDYSYGTLRDVAWVAGRFELSRRRDNLSWSHHREVAALDPQEQETLLDQAAPPPGETKPRMSRSEIRERAREVRTLPEDNAAQYLEASPDEPLTIGEIFSTLPPSPDEEPWPGPPTTSEEEKRFYQVNKWMLGIARLDPEVVASYAVDIEAMERSIRGSRGIIDWYERYIAVLEKAKRTPLRAVD